MLALDVDDSRIAQLKASRIGGEFRVALIDFRCLDLWKESCQCV